MKCRWNRTELRWTKNRIELTKNRVESDQLPSSYTGVKNSHWCLQHCSLQSLALLRAEYGPLFLSVLDYITCVWRDEKNWHFQFYHCPSFIRSLVIFDGFIQVIKKQKANKILSWEFYLMLWCWGMVGFFNLGIGCTAFLLPLFYTAYIFLNKQSLLWEGKKILLLLSALSYCMLHFLCPNLAQKMWQFHPITTHLSPNISSPFISVYYYIYFRKNNKDWPHFGNGKLTLQRGIFINLSFRMTFRYTDTHTAFLDY